MDTGNNEDIGYHDLLFNSAVACVLLFIIFSVKVGSRAATDSVGSSSGSLSSSYSIIPSDDAGEMLSVRMVKIKGLSETTQNRIKTWFIANGSKAGWTHGGVPMPGTDVPFGQLYFEGDAAVFSLVLGKQSSDIVTFQLVSDLIPLSEGVVEVQGRIIEATSAMVGREHFKGYYGTDFMRRNPANIIVDFQVVGEGTFENAIKVR